MGKISDVSTKDLTDGGDRNTRVFPATVIKVGPNCVCF